MSIPDRFRWTAKAGLSRDVVTLLFLFGIVPLVILMVVFFSFYFEGQSRGISTVQSEIAEKIANGISAHLEKTTGQIRIFARMIHLRMDDPDGLKALAYDFLDQGVEYDEVRIISPKGNEFVRISRYYTFRPFELRHVGGEKSFQLAKAGQTHISRIAISEYSQFPHVQISMPIVSPGERITGVLSVGVDVARMWKLISKYRIGEDRRAYVIDSQGTLIAHEDISSVLQKRDLSHIIGVRHFLAGEMGAFEYKGLKGDLVIGANAPVSLTGWGVIVERPIRSAYGGLFVLSGVILGTSVLTMAFAILFGLRFSFMRIVRPIKRLQSEAEVIARGEFGRRIEMVRSDELGQLSQSFNQMVQDLQKTTVSRDLLIKEIEDHKRTEEALRESEERFRTFANEASFEGTVFVDQGKILDVNDQFCEMIGFERHELLGLDFLHIIAPESRDLVSQNLSGLHGRPCEAAALKKEGTNFPIEIKVKEIPYHGKIVRAAAIRDMTEQKRVQDALRRSEEKYRDLFTHGSDLLCVHDLEGRILETNVAFKKEYGFEKGELINVNLRDLLPPQHREGFDDYLRRVIENGTDEGLMAVLLKDGREIVVEYKNTLIRDNNGPVAVKGSARNVTERIMSQRALRESENLLRTVINATKDAIISIGQDGRINIFNPAAEKMFGYHQDEMLGRPLDPILPEEYRKDHREYVQRYFKGEETRGIVGETLELPALKRSGQVFPTEVSLSAGEAGEKTFVVAVLRDISERKKMEDYLLKVQKLDALGALAGGIAHDFNNLLTGIMGNIEIAQMDLKPDEEIYDRLTAARQGCVTATELTRQFITFSKGGDPVRRTGMLTKVIDDSVALALTGSNVKCEMFLDENLWPVKFDEGQIRHVINNLVKNADEAMPAGGTIRIRGENIRIGPGDSFPDLPLSSDAFVKIEVEDQGGGIPEDHLSKIFDPYFSTKEMGMQKGMGLGLATVHSIIKKHDGAIRATSAIGEGSTFTIYLPAVKEKRKKPDTREAVPGTVTTGRVLVMDDEKMVLEIAGQMLTHLGYGVELVEDGTEAVSAYQRRAEAGEPFDVVILDLTVRGGMGGREALRGILSIDPDAKVIVSSGYSDDPVMKDYRDVGFVKAVPKPYDLESLRKAVEEVLAM